MLARTPGIAVSTVVTAALARLLPGPLGWVVFLGALVSAVALLAGTGEPAAVRALFGARALTPTEAAALAPAFVLLCQRGLGPPLVHLYLWPRGTTVAAAGAGHRSVLVTEELVCQVRQGRLSPEQAAAVIAHAAGLVRLGALRSELAVQLWTVPWQSRRGLARAVGAAGRRLPRVALMWRARFVVGLVALGQRKRRSAGGCPVRRVECGRCRIQLPRTPMGKIVVRAAADRRGRAGRSRRSGAGVD